MIEVHRLDCDCGKCCWMIRQGQKFRGVKEGETANLREPDCGLSGPLNEGVFGDRYLEER